MDSNNRNMSGLDDDDMNKVLMRAPKVKDKTPNPVQVTAEQLLIDAQIHQNKDVRPAQQRIMDKTELEEYKLRKRRTFEEKVRKQKNLIGHWVKYALWEESLQEFQRTRSIYERALEVDYKNTSLWLKYVEMEMRHKFIQHARNIWERAITYMPRVDQFWYKYSYMEEMIGQYTNARNIFTRWMTWQPEEKAYLAYCKFEERMQQEGNQREIMYQLLEAHPKYQNYIRVAKFESKQKRPEASRAVFEKGMKELGQLACHEDYFIQFAKFESRAGELQRARQVFQYGLSTLSRDTSHRLYELYVNFEKQHGSMQYIDELVLQKRRIHYKEILAHHPHNYDVWFDICNLEQQAGHPARVLETFHAALKNVPLVTSKKYYQRYMYLWYDYLIHLELTQQDYSFIVQKYQEVLQLIPHKQFSFSKLWVQYAQFYLRQKQLDKCRKVFGQAIAKAPSEKVFSCYIDMELQLGNVDRCRLIYEKYIQTFPDNPTPWLKYHQLEQSLGEQERARAILQMGVNRQDMNMPEALWKQYIDFEISNQEIHKVRQIYQTLLQKSKHVKVWISYAQFELSQQEYQKCRNVFQMAEEYFKVNSDLKEERVMLLKVWREVEVQIGDVQWIATLEQKQPKKVKKQKKILLVDQEEGDQQEQDDHNIRWEEYYDYIFPGDAHTFKNLKILQKAYEWKQKKDQLQAQQQQQQEAQ